MPSDGKLLWLIARKVPESNPVCGPVALAITKHRTLEVSNTTPESSATFIPTYVIQGGRSTCMEAKKLNAIRTTFGRRESNPVCGRITLVWSSTQNARGVQHHTRFTHSAQNSVIQLRKSSSTIWAWACNARRVSSNTTPESFHGLRPTLSSSFPSARRPAQKAWWVYSTFGRGESNPIQNARGVHTTPELFGGFRSL
ncbi:hypothetical protein B0H14DRAFT_2574030 [Mycena olivaceomarginata]|nr:hypothetical protein B0H14DRAFT_2574030 [Mycena olivaceomarginata]